jgi:hypothetical protein
MYDTLPTIKNLDLDYVNLEGYANLRCNWKDCPRPYIIPDLGHEDSPMEAHGTYAEAWVEFFPDARHAVPNSLSTVQRCIDGQLPNMSRSGDGSGVRITDTRTT